MIPINDSQATNVLGQTRLPCRQVWLSAAFEGGGCRCWQGSHPDHSLCCWVSAEFLAWVQHSGPRPAAFSLQLGQRVCLPVNVWQAARDAGVAPPVHLVSTSKQVLKTVSLRQLRNHALASGQPDEAAKP